MSDEQRPVRPYKSTLTLDIAAIKLADKVREELVQQIALTVPTGTAGWLDVTVSGRSHGGRFAVIVEAVIRPPDAPPPDGPEVLRYKLR